MKRAIVIAVLVASGFGCKAKDESGTAPNAGSAAAAASEQNEQKPTPPRPPASSPPVHAEPPFRLPIEAKVILDPKAVDASPLGDEVTLRLGAELGGTDDKTRGVEQFVFLSGTSSMIVRIGRGRDEKQHYKDYQTLAMVEPLSPARPFAPTDAAAILPFDKPILYLKHWGHSEWAADVAVARDGDSVVVWRSESFEAKGKKTTEPWSEQARITLASGAKLLTK